MSNPTRQKILTTTSHLLERQGYHATGLNQIVKESGTPRGSLYYYFPDGKEELATEAVTLRMKSMSEWLRQFLSNIEDPIEAIHAMIMEMSRQSAQNQCSAGAPIAAVALEASNMSERIRNACADGYQGLEDVFVAKMIMGGFPADKAKSLATTINASIEGAMIISRTKQDANILANVADDMKTLMEIALKG